MDKCIGSLEVPQFGLDPFKQKSQNSWLTVSEVEAYNRDMEPEFIVFSGKKAKMSKPLWKN